MKILVIAPHADDETLGMGGTIARFSQEGHSVIVAVLTGHGEEHKHPLWPLETWEIVRAEFKAACSCLGVSDFIFEEIPAAMVADQPSWKLNKVTNDLLERVQPNVLFVPFLNDLHKDHRELFHSFSVGWRPYTTIGHQIKEVYTYETPSETHLNFPYVEQGFFPNVWIDVSDFIDIKLRALSCYRSQMQESPSARSLEAVKALAIWRGSQIGIRAAEAFVVVRIIK